MTNTLQAPIMIQDSRLDSLISMLYLNRPSRGTGEEKLIEKYIKPLGVKKDKFGNFFLKIGEDTKTIWACHTDTVHMMDNVDEAIKTKQKKQLWIDKNINSLNVSNSSCLGADDGAGIWLMTNMIKDKVPGLYIFHREEEMGCRGSRYINKHYKRLVEKYDFCISLDRKGTDSIITHQGPRTCSDTFAESLSFALDMGHKKDPTGSYTDSKEYAENIAECTNLSVGYYNQHTNRESQDLDYIHNLLDHLLAFDEKKLVAERKKGPLLDYYSGYYSGYGSYYEYEEDEYDYERIPSLYENVKAYPAIVSSLLKESGISEEELESVIQDHIKNFRSY